MIDYNAINLRDKKMQEMILYDYEVINHLFKVEITFFQHVKNLMEKYSNNEKLFISDYENEYNASEYYSFICMLDNFLVTEKIDHIKSNNNFGHIITFKDKKFSMIIKKKNNTFYLSIDNLYNVAINGNNVLCNLSLSNKKFYYSYLSGIVENYLNITTLLDRDQFITIIKNNFLK